MDIRRMSLPRRRSKRAQFITVLRMTPEYVKRTASDHIFILYIQFKANKNNIRATTTATEVQGKPRFYYAGVRETLG
jgi:hypothetical protein